MIEAIVTSLSLRVGTRLLRAAIEDKELGRADASDLAATFLEAIVLGQRKTNEDQRRLEQKVDTLLTNPYHASMAAGSRLLADASPGHRTPEDRRAMLAEARQQFANAVGNAHGRPVDEARADVMYGLVWAAMGSPEDLAHTLDRATATLQREILVAFQLSAAENLAYERRRAAPVTKFREAILGPDAPDLNSSGADRFAVARGEYEAIWDLWVMTGLPNSYPRLDAPHGSTYSHPRPGMPIRVTLDLPQTLGDVNFTLSREAFVLENRGSHLVRAALVDAVLGTDGVVSPDVAALDRQGQVAPSGSTIRIQHDGTEPPAACVSLGRAEGVEVAALVHAKLDWTFQSLWRRQFRLGH